jgi:hypothetical protein
VNLVVLVNALALAGEIPVGRIHLSRPASSTVPVENVLDLDCCHAREECDFVRV